jgi:hypothetical protein
MKPILLTLLAIAAVLAPFLLSRRISAQTATPDAAVAPTTFVFVKIPESIMPVDRGEKYEDPLDKSLKKDALGEVTGGGSQLGEPDKDGARHIEWVGIDVELVDLARGLPALKAELKRLGVPPGTSIEYETNGEKITEEL